MRRPLLWLTGIVLVLLPLGALGAISGWHALNRARQQLLAARSTLSTAATDSTSLRTAAGRAQTRSQLDAAVAQIASARRIVAHSPALFASRFVPLVARQRNGVDQLIDDSQTGAETAKQLLNQVDRLASQNMLRDGSIPFAGMAELEQAMRSAGEQVKSLDHSSAWLVGSLRDSRKSFDRIAVASSTRLLNGADALGAARTFLGSSGDRRYFVALQNNAEMRDQGMVLSYAAASVRGGHLTIDKTGAINELSLKQPVPVSIPAGTSQAFGSLNPTLAWQSVNATADFAWSGRAMSAMYRAASGQPVDGVIAIDVPGLVPLLRAVGPVTVAGVAAPVTADNVSQVILHDLYEQYPLQAETTRQQVLGAVAGAVIGRLRQGSYDLVSLGRDLALQVAGGHLHLWSPVPTEEHEFEQLGIGGGPGTVDASRTVHVAIENRTTTKLDYFVHPVVQEDVSLDSKGTATVRTTVTVDNRAPVGAKPSYQLGPDEFHTTTRPGDYIAWVLLWGPAGSTQSGSVPESGLELSQAVVPVAAGQRVPVTFQTVIPNAVRGGKLELRMVPQPRLSAADVTVTLVAPGWNVQGASTVHFSWEGVKRVSWGVAH